jgi:hypothetical protein
VRTLFRPAQGITIVLFNSGNEKSLAHRGWYIYVSFPAVPCFQGAGLYSLYLTIQYSTPAFRV